MVTMPQDNSLMSQLSGALPNDNMQSGMMRAQNKVIPQNDDNKMMKEFNETRDEFLKMLMTNLQWQDPEDPYDSKDITTVAAHLATIDEQVKMRQATEKLVEQNERSALLKGYEFIGQEIFYDDSERTMNDYPVKFNYTLDYDNNIISHADVKTTLIVRDSDGVEVYRTQGKRGAGKHEFVWDGTQTESKEKLRWGKYSLEVEATYCNQGPDGQINQFPINVELYKSGKVTEVHERNGEPFLVVDGQELTISQIRKIRERSASEKDNVDQLMQYIGKNVKVLDNQLQVFNGRGTINFNNDIQNPGSAQIKITDHKGEFVAISQMKDVKYGDNEFEWDGVLASSLEELQYYYLDKKENPLRKVYNGDFNFQVSVLDQDNGKYVDLDHSKDLKINSIDRVDDRIVLVSDNGDRIYKEQIIKLNNNVIKQKPQNQFADGAGYIDKLAVLRNKMLVGDDGGHFDLRLTRPQQNEYYTGLNLEILDKDNNLVTTKSIDRLNFAGNIAAPNYEELSAESRARIDKYVTDKFGEEVLENGITEQQEEEIQKFIIEQFEYGAIYDEATAQLSPEEIKATTDKNAGINSFKWDGLVKEGEESSKVPSGVYNLRINLGVMNRSTGLPEDRQLYNDTMSYISGVNFENGQMKLSAINPNTRAEEIIELDDIYSVRVR